ncbi:MAG: YbaK/EbsC family protein [Hyphomicrobiales bacterium]|nr:YbaK/EbsC family protein [Hyphomicrobiales bacterium]
MTQEPKALPASAQKVQEAARALGLDVTVMEMAESTRTAADAAVACGCEVGQIVKSLLFRGVDSCKPIMVLVSGSNRLNEKAIAEVLGEQLERPDAAYVREVTGYAIGGVPPFGYETPVSALIDRDLLQYEVVWAAAGTPRAVFSVASTALADAVGAQIIQVT